MNDEINTEEFNTDKIPDKFIKTKSFIAIFITIVGGIGYLGFNLSNLLKAKEEFEIEKVKFEIKKLDMQAQMDQLKVYKEIFGGKNSDCSVSPELLNRLSIIEGDIILLKENSHPPAG